MPVQTDHPITHISGGMIAQGSDVIGAVGSNNGDTSYVFGSFSSGTQVYGMPDLPGPAGSVNSVLETVRARRVQLVGNSQAGPLINGNGTSVGLSELTQSYVAYQAGWNTNLTVAGVAAGTSGISMFDSAGGEVRVTEVVRETDYALAPAGYFFYMGALLGAAIQLADVAAAADYLNRRSRAEWEAWRNPSMTIIQAAEIPAAYADIRSYRHPRFFDLGRA